MMYVCLRAPTCVHAKTYKDTQKKPNLQIIGSKNQKKTKIINPFRKIDLTTLPYDEHTKICCDQLDHVDQVLSVGQVGQLCQFDFVIPVSEIAISG